MDEETLNDATALWEDVIALLEDDNMNPATLGMLRSCVPSELTGDTLTIDTNLSFVRRRISQERDAIEARLSEAAFQPMHLNVNLTKSAPTPAAPIAAQMPPVPTPAPAPQSTPPQDAWAQTSAPAPASAAPQPAANRPSDLLAEEIPDNDSKLTFDRFVSGDENMLALEAAKQVANGMNKNYNPLFIYGKSGLGKTHLLRAIQNYIAANDPTRLCVYRTAGQFIDDYVNAMNNPSAPPRSVLAKGYQDVDVLIIDDIQNMGKAAGSIGFFFETFNALVSHNKQVVLAADRSPSQLGMGDSKFDDRDTSRMDSGITVSVQVPDYELKLNLINAFYERMKVDAKEEHVQGLDGTISDELRRLMAQRSGASIRLIKGFVQSCLMVANQKEQHGEEITREDIIRLAQQKWPTGQKVATIDQIQKEIERYYDIPHEDLVGSKRNKELMEPRHVAIWLARELTDNTLADIGKRFGNRTHATIKHSITWVEEVKDKDRIFYDKVEAIRNNITDGI